jgi:outer membrane protein TolC
VVPTTLNPNELMTQLIQTGFKVKTFSGGQYDIHFQSERYNFQKAVGIFNSALERQTIWDDQVVLQVTQPLLQNFGDDVNRAKITIARNDQKISQLDYRLALEKHIETVEETYWKLAQAQRDVEIAKKVLEDTQATLDETIHQLAGRATTLNVEQVRSQYFDRAAALIDSQRSLLNASDELKRLMSDPDYPPGSDVILLPADQPIDTAVQFALDDQVETALHNRAELMQQKVRIDSARTVIRAARNNMLPQLNLQGSVGVEGFGNGPFGHNSAFDQVSEAQLFNWAFGFQFEVPMGHRVERAIYQRTLLQHLAAVLEYQRLQQQVVTDVKQAQNDLQKYWDMIDARRKSRLSAKVVLDEFDKMVKAGAAMSTELLQVQLQQQIFYANAASQEAAAIAQYNIALSTLERAKGTLLPYNNIVMKEEAGPWKAAGTKK